ncbi:hypothetical protein T439DRAFT_320780 [Meredithblackwellia eburnea MCA 4105]
MGVAECGLCRQRRTVCDGGFPCSACAIAGSPSSDCTYHVQFDWEDQSPDLVLQSQSHSQLVVPPATQGWNQIIAVLRPLSLMPDASPFDLSSIHHFLRGVAPTLVAIEVEEANPNYSYLPISLNAQSKSLYHALVAAGAAHARNWGLDVDPKDISRSERKSLGLLEQDLVALGTIMKNKHASDGELSKAVNAILAVLQTLILLGTTVGDVKLWRRHLEGAAGLINQVLKMRKGKSPLVLDTFLLETIRYIDMQSALALDCGPSIPNVMIESGWDPSQVLLDPSVTGMHGFSKGYLEIVTRISNLSHKLHTVRSSSRAPPPPPSNPHSTLNHASSSSLHRPPPPPPSPPQNHPASPVPVEPQIPLEFQAEVHEIYDSLESTRASIAHLEHDSSFRIALLQRLSLGNHAEKLDGHFRFADVCYFACCVYLARTVCRERRLGEQGLGWVYSGLDALGKVPFEGSAGNLLGWALVIIGSELENDEPARGMVRLRMQALAALGHRNLSQCADLLEEVWRRKDASSSSSSASAGLGTGGQVIVTWQGTMKELGWDLLVA